MFSHSVMSRRATEVEPESSFVERFLLYRFFCLGTFVGEGKKKKETLVDEGIR